jgi:hypothetical protein
MTGRKIMPTSTPIFKSQTINYITKHIDKETNIIDIGAGVGTYADLLKPLGYNNIDAIEVYEPYIEGYHLKDKYRSVFNHNIINSELYLDDYKLAILGDVIEHMTYRDSLIVLNKLKSCEDIIIGVPFNAKQDSVMGNEYEVHIQNDLYNEKFLQMYPDFELYCLRYDYGIYLKKNNKNNNEPIYTLDITEQDKAFLSTHYSSKNIINLNLNELNND